MVVSSQSLCDSSRYSIVRQVSPTGVCDQWGPACVFHGQASPLVWLVFG